MNGSLEGGLVPAFMDYFEEFEIPEEEVTADMVEPERELELEVEPEGETALPQSRGEL